MKKPAAPNVYFADQSLSLYFDIFASMNLANFFFFGISGPCQAEAEKMKGALYRLGGPN